MGGFTGKFYQIFRENIYTILNIYATKIYTKHLYY